MPRRNYVLRVSRDPAMDEVIPDFSMLVVQRNRCIKSPLPTIRYLGDIGPQMVLHALNNLVHS